MSQKPDISQFRRIDPSEPPPKKDPAEFLNSNPMLLHARQQGQPDPQDLQDAGAEEGLAVEVLIAPLLKPGPGQKRQTVQGAWRIEINLLEALKMYSNLTGIAQTEILENALREYLPKLRSRLPHHFRIGSTR